MNPKKIFLTAFVFLSLSFSVFAAPSGDNGGEDPEKSKSIFVFKAHKKFEGAKVDVLSPEGNVITSQKLQKRKMIIDFADVREGTYTIRLSKGGAKQEFQYEKK